MEAHARTGLLQVAPELLCSLLGIEPHHSISGARMTDDGTVELSVSGPSMPAAVNGQPQPVSLRISRQAIVASWSHEPNKQWTVKG